MTAATRIQVLEHAAEILAYMRTHPRDEHCSPECNSVQGVLAAALLCLSEDVAQSVREEEAHEGALATAELKAALCTRQPALAAMVDLRKPRKVPESWPWVALWIALLVLVAGAVLAKC